MTVGICFHEYYAGGGDVSEEGRISGWDGTRQVGGEGETVGEVGEMVGREGQRGGWGGTDRWVGWLLL